MKTKTLILIFAAIIAVSICLIYFNPFGGDNHIAQVYKDGKLVYTVDLRTVDKSFVHKIDEHNSVKVENGSICMYYSDCPDKLCIKQGKIHDSSKPIICLPNRVEIRITGQGEVDAVAK